MKPVILTGMISPLLNGKFNENLFNFTEFGSEFYKATVIITTFVPVYRNCVCILITGVNYN